MGVYRCVAQPDPTHVPSIDFFLPHNTQFITKKNRLAIYHNLFKGACVLCCLLCSPQAG